MRQAEHQLDFGLGTNNDPVEMMPTHERLEMTDADVTIFRVFFNHAESDRFFSSLLNQTRWRQDKIRMYGKQINLPRLTAWYGDPGKSYTYSGISMDPDPWTETLLEIKSRVDREAQIRFNSVLLSLYRNGNDSLSWHQDDEPELGEDPVIASVSFGATRLFQFRYKPNKNLPKVTVDLTHGSLLIMKGPTQRFWMHQVPKTSRPVDPRINLTFRVIQDY
ncbi:MAG TPA: alpha-ketoglutarate-dependent dioxygenase AlkB [Pyrinomonadaceae bacterium]|nr:alpha-ketoglutarate-dependent dioxygenase AlkB [Pyrinomonadaceae bacterium]